MKYSEIVQYYKSLDVIPEKNTQEIVIGLVAAIIGIFLIRSFSKRVLTKPKKRIHGYGNWKYKWKGQVDPIGNKIFRDHVGRPFKYSYIEDKYYFYHDWFHKEVNEGRRFTPPYRMRGFFALGRSWLGSFLTHNS